jgi:hypothetical protein
MTVNKNFNEYERRLILLDRTRFGIFCDFAVLVNNIVDNNSCSETGIVLPCDQFIERTGTTGIRRKKEDASSEDNPRRLGKGWARLVGAAPLE